MKQIYLLGSILLLVFHGMISYGQENELPAFPGAEGYAMYATGGRGGTIYHVTHLNDDNTMGSLRTGVEMNGTRTIVFDVSGTIQLKKDLKISRDNITIAGQTAPGDGICLADYHFDVSANNVIIRFMRFRMGDVTKQENDALGGRNKSNVIIDHCSMSWSTDECASFYDNTNFTMQWCLISESLRISVHDKGAHGYGGIWGGKGASFHHNLLADHDSRNPRFCGSRYSNRPDLELIDFRNNVIYNWGGNSVYGDEGGSYNIINNYYKSGPATKSSIKYKIIQCDADNGGNNQPKGVHGMFYVDGNYTVGNTTISNNNWAGGVYLGSNYVNGETLADIKSDHKFAFVNVTTHTAEDAYEKVLAYVGASLVRDTIDKRMVHDAHTGTVTFTDGGNGSKNGIIDTQSAVGGWPELNSSEAPIDTDQDGMPDTWETANSLDPADAADAKLKTVDGIYTNIEVYINSLVAAIVDDQNAGGSIETSSPQVLLKKNDLIAYYNRSLQAIIVKNDCKLIRIKIFSLTGAMVKTYELNQNRAQLDVSSVRKGVYIVGALDETNSWHSQKVIIQ